MDLEEEVKGRSVNKLRDNDGLHKRRGIWHYRLKVAGRWHEFSAHTPNYQEARQIRQQAVQANDEGCLPIDSAKLPFEKAATLWLDDRALRISPQTHRIDRERLVPLRRAFGTRRLCDITNLQIRAYLVTRSTNVGPRTINLETKVLRMILKASRLWTRLADDYKPLIENRKGPGRALTIEEEKNLFEVAGSNSAWAVVYYAAQIAVNTTARSCEIKGLRLADVDLISRTMTVRRATSKTDAGCRIVPLNETATWALARLLERAANLGSTCAEHYLLPSLKFRRTIDGPNLPGVGYDPTSSMKSWRTAWRSLTRAIHCPACNQAQRPGKRCRNHQCGSDIGGLRSSTHGLRFHDLRHHCITRLAEAGVAEQTLMAIAGHVSREMLEHYSHIRIQAKREAVAALDLQIQPLQVPPSVSVLN